MTSEERRDSILEVVRRRGFVVVEDLAKRFDVTSQTIRRDIKAMVADGLLVRHHGGAGLPSSGVNSDYATRRISQLAEKEAIARELIGHIPDNASVFVAVGSTMEVVARALLERTDMRVITNNVHVATTLHSKPDFEVLTAGGVIRSHNGGIIGPSVEDFINRFRVDYAVMSIGGIEQDGALLDYDTNEVAVMQAMMKNARHVLIAADHTKFGRTSTVYVGNLADVTALITNRPPPKYLAQLLNDNDVAVHLANVEDDAGY